MLRQQASGGDEPLGHERAAVDQLAGLAEPGEVDLHLLAAKRRQPRHGAGELFGSVAVAQKVEGARSGKA